MDWEQFTLPFLLTVVAGLSTGIGSLISVIVKDFKKAYLCFAVGLSAGVMIYISFGELLPNAVNVVGFGKANVAFFIGILFILVLDFLIPHDYIAERAKIGQRRRRLMRAGYLMAIGIAIHNFPEGMVVFVSALGDISIGIPLAIAIAVHNIPEGIAVAMPIYFATKSRAKSVTYSFLSGVAEPIGAIVAALILIPVLTDTILALSLAFVAGIMVFISFDELLPLSVQEHRGHLSVIGVITGMAIMALSLFLL